jgi:glycosyltransferase involved in cell wall biosynthesis
MTAAWTGAAPSTGGDGTAHHVVFAVVGQGERTLGRHKRVAMSASQAPARLRTVAQALCDLGQQVSFVEDVTSGPGSEREIACDVLIVVPVGPAGPGVSSRAGMTARWRILWVDRIELVRNLDPADFDYVYAAWAHLRPDLLAWSGLAADRVLTTGLGVSGRVAVTPPTPPERDPHRVVLLAGSEPALPVAAEILRGLREHDARFSVEILGELDGGGLGPAAADAGVSLRSTRREDELSEVLAKTGVLVVTGSAADRQADIVVLARKSGVIVVAPDRGTASEVVFPEYDGVLLEEDSESPEFPKACVTAVLRLRDDSELAERFRARAMTEPLSWRAVAREWVAHWGRLDASAAAAQRPPRVSVVMAVWNEARYVEQAVDSILSQTVWDLELIVVNDGSTDGTRDILRRCRDARLKVIDQDNTGLWAALNRGLREVRGELVARMDGDDVAHPRRLQYQLDFLEGDPAVALLGTACYKVDASGRMFMIYAVPTDDLAIKRRLPHFSQFVHPSVLMRRDALDRVGGYRRHEAEDYDLFLRMSERFHVANLDRPLHRLRRTGMTRVARFEREIVDSVRQCAQLARQRCIEGLDHAADPARRWRPVLGLPLADLRWSERRPYARTLHAVGEALVGTDRTTARRLFARAIVLAPEIFEHWRSWLHAAPTTPGGP